MTNFRKPIDTRTIIPKHNETVEYPCDDCGKMPIKVLRVEVETQKQLFEATLYFDVKFRCQCLHCGFKQTVQLVTMP